jgi:hypothetical protein
MRHRSLPRVVIPVPCHADWNLMQPLDREGRSRLCGACAKPVYDSKSMTRGELERLIARHEGRRLPCLQLHLRPDGTIVTRDCFAPVVRAGRWLWLQACLAGIAFWTAVSALHPELRRVYRAATTAERAPEREVRAQVMRRMKPVTGTRELKREIDEISFPGGVELANDASIALSERQDLAMSGFVARALDPKLDPDRAPPLRLLEVDEESPLKSLAPR